MGVHVAQEYATSKCFTTQNAGMVSVMGYHR
jgi:hypothetical protein